MPHREDSDSEFEPLGPSGAPAFVNKPLGRQHDLYLVGAIRDPAYYVNWFEIIRNAKEGEVVIIHVNSPGGDGWTTVQLLRAMGECRGQLIVSIEGMCLSAATFIFLQAPRVEISTHSMFMFHNFSGLLAGKAGEMFDQVTATHRWGAELFNDIYRDFLTPEEISSILAGKDLWMDSKEALARLQKRMAQQRTEALAAEKKALEDAQTQIQTMITDVEQAEQTPKKKQRRSKKGTPAPLPFEKGAVLKSALDEG